MECSAGQVRAGNMVIQNDANETIITAVGGGYGTCVTHHHAELPWRAHVRPRLSGSRTFLCREHIHPKSSGAVAERMKRRKGKRPCESGLCGQGDSPFWANIWNMTPTRNGALMGELIEVTVQAGKGSGSRSCAAPTSVVWGNDGAVPGGLPEASGGCEIKIWADNGYGKWVSRRQGTTNSRVCTSGRGEEHG